MGPLEQQQQKPRRVFSSNDRTSVDTPTASTTGEEQHTKPFGLPEAPESTTEMDKAPDAAAGPITQVAMRAYRQHKASKSVQMSPRVGQSLPQQSLHMPPQTGLDLPPQSSSHTGRPSHYPASRVPDPPQTPQREVRWPSPLYQSGPSPQESSQHGSLQKTYGQKLADLEKLLDSIDTEPESRIYNKFLPAAQNSLQTIRDAYNERFGPTPDEPPTQYHPASTSVATSAPITNMSSHPASGQHLDPSRARTRVRKTKVSEAPLKHGKTIKARTKRTRTKRTRTSTGVNAGGVCLRDLKEATLKRRSM
ncbi:hypothetical protein PRZ48_004281 [Zasmidium cellare]|uniref:Uncharacterized protein n=1 Tax=Zasmidium cellare TaxID=395010 RepID=A0ABR0EQ38_ZASCE|nr:hypothetical protein PRZ48_004281 [Zasmidium cellare]